MSKNTQRKDILWYPGFEWLRMVLIGMVLAMHLCLPHSIQSAYVSALWSQLLPAVHFILLCSAVPSFLIISSFLQEKKAGAKNKELFLRLGSLYIVWVGLWVLVTKYPLELSLTGIIEYALRGGGWAFYYFAALIICHLIRVCTTSFSNTVLWCLLMGSLVAVELVFTFCSDPALPWSERQTYWWPICMLPTPWMGMLLSRYEQTWRNRKIALRLIVILTLLIVSLYVWERHVVTRHSMTSPFQVLPEYLRATPHLMAGLITFLALFIKKVPVWVQWFARNSLGIFCLHVFILAGVAKAVGILIPQAGFKEFFALLATMLLTSVGADVLRYALTKKII